MILSDTEVAMFPIQPRWFHPILSLGHVIALEERKGGHVVEPVYILRTQTPAPRLLIPRRFDGYDNDKKIVEKSEGAPPPPRPQSQRGQIRETNARFRKPR